MALPVPEITKLGRGYRVRYNARPSRDGSGRTVFRGVWDGDLKTVNRRLAQLVDADESNKEKEFFLWLKEVLTNYG